MATLVYSPGVECLIATRDGSVIDVSEHITGGQIILRENAPNSMSLRLLNKRRMYDKVFTPNDRFVLYMKRITKMLIMTGYLDTVPFFTVWPRSIQIDGTSTLKRMQYHWWDPGSLAATNLMRQGPSQAGSSASTDGGLALKATNLLTQVGGWPKEQIHIGAIPPDWLNKITTLYNSVTPKLALDWATLSGGSIQGGITPLDPSITTSQRADAPDNGAQLPNSFPRAIPYSGPQDIQSVASDSYFCQMPWGYKLPNGASAGFNAANDKAWLAQRKIMVVNPNNNNAVICLIAGWGPPSGDNQLIGLSSAALNFLKLDTQGFVDVRWLTQGSVEANARIGPWDINTQNDPNLRKVLSQHGENLGTTTPGNPTAIPVVGAAQATGATAAINYCIRQIGKPYSWGAGRPIDGKDKNSYDCSSLVANGWFSAGVSIGGNYSTTISQIQDTRLQSVDKSQLQPGDLLYFGAMPNPHHVQMYIGNNQIIEALGTGIPVHIASLNTGGDFSGAKRVTNQPSSSGTINGNNNGATPATGPPLITIWDWYGQAPDPVSELLSGPRAMMNDTPLLPEIGTIINASMRSWGNAPNGDFIAWFPDYFGAYNTAGKMAIADVEIQDFSIVWSDQHLVTHQFTAGTWTPDPFSPTPGGPVGYNEMFTTCGVVSVDFPEILQALFNLSPADADPVKIMTRFGARPNYQAISNISQSSPTGHEAEFWFALYLFQKNWAEQFTAVVPITFMPELYPGMLMQIPTQKFQAYVTQVTHTFDLSDGAGFQTQVNIVAPSASDGTGLWGLPRGGFGALL